MNAYAHLRPTLATKLSTLSRSRPIRPPPPLLSRQAATSQGNRRAFHVVPSVVVEAIEGVPDALIALHSALGTPWALTIPVLALIPNIIRLPFNIHSRRVLQRRVHVQPLFRAWINPINKESLLQKPDLERHQLEITRRHNKTTKRVYRALGLQEWRLYLSLLGFPFWLLLIDGLRRVCGGPQGILGRLFLTSRVRSDGADTAAQVHTDAASASGSAAAPQTATQVATDNASSAVAEAGVPSTPDVVSTAVQPLDPTLMTEGMLWFPDLSVPDPYGILPIALSAILVLNMWPKTEAARAALGLVVDKPKSPNAVLPMKIQRTVYRTGFLVACLLGPLTMDLPAALHLYWFSSACTGLALREVISKMMPMPKAVEVPPCMGKEVAMIRPKRLDDKRAKAAKPV